MKLLPRYHAFTLLEVCGWVAIQVFEFYFNRKNSILWSWLLHTMCVCVCFFCFFASNITSSMCSHSFFSHFSCFTDRSTFWWMNKNSWVTSSIKLCEKWNKLLMSFDLRQLNVLKCLQITSYCSNHQAPHTKSLNVAKPFFFCRSIEVSTQFRLLSSFHCVLCFCPLVHQSIVHIFSKRIEERKD